ncbi:hypothetical protein LTR35_001785 [Friedmanniomyces endolithicus]|nr:hypothetical protein LTR35_001785 [Friedmanniomyces endolithicus]KAK0296871.1 hypothetical protein LTS00_004671 [Friedmanniomyces endolithicus]
MRHRAEPETCTNTCSTYTDNIAEPYLARRPRKMPCTFKAAGQLRRAANWIRGLAAKVIRDRKKPAHSTERKRIRQRLREEVRKRFTKRRYHAGSRRPDSKQAGRGTRQRATPPVRRQRDVSVERKKAASIIAATAKAFARWIKRNPRETLTPESFETLPSVEVPTTPPIPTPKPRPEALSRKRANRKAVIINSHLLEANGMVSEVWFAGEDSVDVSLCAPVHPLAIEPADIPEINESVDDRAALPSERRRRVSGQAGFMGEGYIWEGFWGNVSLDREIPSRSLEWLCKIEVRTP